jgi:hypothetical protein
VTEKITLTYLNVRQSIAILLFKLVVLDLILAVIVIGFYFILVQGGVWTQTLAANTYLFLITFTVIGGIKVFLTIYIVLLWLNEYYEITPEHIVHKKGIIHRTTESYNLEKVRIIDIQDSFFGELFNFATVTLYDIRLKKYLDLYLIHNPGRYVKILRTLKPDLEIKTDHINLPFLPKDENSGEDER